MKTNKLLSALLLGGIIASPLIADFHHTFESGASGWYSPGYWGGKLDISQDFAKEGKKSLKLSATDYKGKVYARSIVHITPKYLAGRKIKIGYFARGTGEIYSGALIYDRRSDGGQSMTFKYSEPLNLNDNWQYIEYIADFSETFAAGIAPMIELRGAGTAYVDELNIKYLLPEDLDIKSLSRHQVLREGMAIPQLKFKFSKGGEPIRFFAISENRKVLPTQSSATCDADGSVTYTGAAILPPGAVTVIAASGGCIAASEHAVLSAAEYDRLDKTASRIRLGKPFNVLFLGDSLTDFDRGFNHADKVDFWLGKYNQGKYNTRNAAVRGDFITRVEARLNWTPDKRMEFQQSVYKHLFDPKYDMIFIFLGHNDTMANSKNEYKTPLVSSDEAEASFKRVLAQIRQKSDAGIVLISSASLNHERSRKVADSMSQTTGAGYLFGVPEFLEGYNAMLQKVAAETGCTFVDVYTTMKTLPNRNELLKKEDGVHLTPAGQNFIAEQILNFLAAEKDLLQ